VWTDVGFGGEPDFKTAQALCFDEMALGHLQEMSSKSEAVAGGFHDFVTVPPER
jgi:hypothetical protein